MKPKPELIYPSFTLGYDNNYILAIILYRCCAFLAIIRYLHKFFVVIVI